MISISIIVPVYNVLNELPNCIESILNQSFKDFELILIDDGSNDGSENICEYYKSKDKRVIVIHQRNQGVSAARNNGLSIAKGEYISFVDSDDIIHPNFLKTLFDGFDNNCEITMVYYKKIYNNNCLFASKSGQAPFTLSKYEYWNYLFPENNDVVIWNKMFKRNILNGIKFVTGKRHEDEFIIHRMIDACNYVYVIPNDFYFYLQRENSFTSVINKNYGDFCSAMIDRIDCFYRDKKYDFVLRKTIYKFIYNYFLLSNGRECVETPDLCKQLKKDFSKKTHFLGVFRLGIKCWLQTLLFNLSPNLCKKVFRSFNE